MIRLEKIHLKINDKLLLKDESISIYEGSIHAIIGESGCGKTALIHEISLLSNISDSIYKWDEISVDKLTNKEKDEIRRNNIGYVLQDLELISENLSLEDNMKCMYALTGQNYSEEKSKEYMKRLNLFSSLNNDVSSLSRGEKQRFALVLALIKDADLIVCDEPTSALDIENSFELMRCLKLIAKEYHKMIVIATHDNIVIENADIVYKIENMQIINKKIILMK